MKFLGLSVPLIRATAFNWVLKRQRHGGGDDIECEVASVCGTYPEVSSLPPRLVPREKFVVNGERTMVCNGNGNGFLPPPRAKGLDCCLRQEQGWVSCLLPKTAMMGTTMATVEAIPPCHQLHGRRQQGRPPRRRQEVPRMRRKAGQRTGRRSIPGAADKRERETESKAAQAQAEEKFS